MWNDSDGSVSFQRDLWELVMRPNGRPMPTSFNHLKDRNMELWNRKCYIRWKNFNWKYLPRSTILPNRFLPRKKFFVEQFHLRFRNWCWHSEMARLAPLTSAARTPGFSRTSRRCFRRSVEWMAGSKNATLAVNGDILFGSPTFAMPL